MDQGRDHHRDVTEIHLPGGMLLMGAPTLSEMVFWQKATGQERLSPVAAHQLRLNEAALIRLRHSAARAGLLSHRPYITNRAVVEAVQHAIEVRSLLAVFFPAPIELRRDHTVALARGRRLDLSFSLAWGTRAERLTEIVRRTPAHLQGSLKQFLEKTVSTGSAATLGSSLGRDIAGNPAGLVGPIDVALPSLSFALAKWKGLAALKDIMAATTRADRAIREADLDDVAYRFAQGFAVLGEPFLAAIMIRGARSSASGGAGDTVNLQDTHRLRQRLRSQSAAQLTASANVGPVQGQVQAVLASEDSPAQNPKSPNDKEEPEDICRKLRDEIMKFMKELKKRFDELRRNEGNLPQSKPSEPDKRYGYRSIEGEQHQYNGVVRGLRNRLTDWSTNGCGPPPADAWKWAESTAPEPAPKGDDFSESKLVPIAEAGTMVGAAYIIYRGIRMLPSLLPPLWWTIPANAAIP